jgi:tRNA/rRNA methyltransferase
MQTRFVLIQTSHAGNVGAAARAMKVMGFDDLVLVAPRWANVLRREETIQRASGALDVLDKARIVATLDEALDGMTHLCATAMTPRDFGPPTVAPRPHFEALAAQARAADGGAGQGVAFLFGSERFGMQNEDVYRCHVALSIPTHPSFGSLEPGCGDPGDRLRMAPGFGAYPVQAATAAPTRRTHATGCRLACALGTVACRDRFSGSGGTQEADAAAESAVQPGRLWRRKKSTFCAALPVR